MSALPPKADIETQSRDVRFVPKADIADTAEGFYRKLGYVAVGEKLYGTERTIMMEKHLGPLGDADH
jgi:hypothetical protein